MIETKRYGLIIMGKKPVYFDKREDRQTVIKNIKGLLTYSTFTAKKKEKGAKKIESVEKFSHKGINKHIIWRFKENNREIWIDKNHDVLGANFYIYEREKDSVVFGGEGCGTIWYPTLEVAKLEVERLFKTGESVKTGESFDLCKQCKCSYSYKSKEWNKAEKEFLCNNIKIEYANKVTKGKNATKTLKNWCKCEKCGKSMDLINGNTVKCKSCGYWKIIS